MLLAIEAADRLVGAVAERGSLPAREAARELFALAAGRLELALTLLDSVVAEDARLVRRGPDVCLAASPSAELPVGLATYAVLDVETTGFVAGPARITEAAVVRLAAGRLESEVELSVGPECAPADIVTDLLAHAGNAVLVGHNLRFDLAFLDHELRSRGLRIAALVVDTLPLARRLLAGRTVRFALADLAEFFGTAWRPEHRALPDARATAEIFARLCGIAEDAGARTVGDLAALSRSRS